MGSSCASYLCVIPDTMDLQVHPIYILQMYPMNLLPLIELTGIRRYLQYEKVTGLPITAIPVVGLVRLRLRDFKYFKRFYKSRRTSQLTLVEKVKSRVSKYRG